MHPRPPTSTLFPYTTLFRSPLRVHDVIPLGVVLEKPGDLLRWILEVSIHHHHDITGHMIERRRECRLVARSEEHTSELQSRRDLVCRLLLEKKKNTTVANKA